MKTSKKPKATTASPFDFLYDEETNNEKSSSYYLEEGVSGLGLCLCLIQLFILTRKDLRNDIVFFFITVITICDVVFSSGTLLWSLIEYLAQDGCSKKYLYFHQIVRTGIILTQQMAKNISLLSIILVSVLKIFKIKVRSVYSGRVITILVFLIYTIWSLCSIYHYKIDLVEVNFKNCHTSFSYEFSIDPDFYQFQQSVNDKITILLFILLSIIFAINIIKLLVARCTQNGINDHTTLIAMLSLTFFFSEFFSFAIFSLDKFLLREFFIIPGYLIQMLTNIFTVLSIVWRCCICYLASPEYAATARKPEEILSIQMVEVLHDSQD